MKIGCGPFCMLLFLLFLGLKLGEVGSVATWSWWVVTAPLWGFAVVVSLIVALVIVIGIIVGIVDSKR